MEFNYLLIVIEIATGTTRDFVGQIPRLLDSHIVPLVLLGQIPWLSGST